MFIILNKKQKIKWEDVIWKIISIEEKKTFFIQYVFLISHLKMRNILNNIIEHWILSFLNIQEKQKSFLIFKINEKKNNWSIDY